jgi:hypothetical protein
MPPPEPAPETAAPRYSWIARALLTSAVALLMLGMLLPGMTLKSLRADIAPLSRVLSWLDHLAPNLDLVHLLLFAWITLCVRWVFPRLRAWQVALLALALAAASEVLQLMAPGRGPGLYDIGQDLLGVTLGLVIGWLLRAMRRPALASALRQGSGWLLLAGLLALPWMRWEVYSLFRQELLAADLLLAGALGLRLLALAAGDALHPSRFHAWLAAYVALMALAVLVQVTSVSFYLSFGKWIGVLYLALLAVLAHDLARNDSFRRRMVMTWLLATAVVSALVLVAAAGFWLSPSLREAVEPLMSRYGSLPVGNYPRVLATFANPNMLCSYLTVGLALTLAARTLGWLSPRVGAALAGLVTLAAVFTVSPGWGGIALVWTIWAWTVQRVERPRLAAAMLAGGLAFAALMLLACAVDPMDPFGEPSVRWRIWQAALQTVLANPWLGVGVGRAVVEVFHLAPDGGLQQLSDAHNIWLNVAGQAGVFAALALAGLLVHLAWKPAAPVADDASRTLRFALVLALVGAWGFQGLTSSLEDARHLWLMLGLLAACVPAVVSARAGTPS